MKNPFFFVLLLLTCGAVSTALPAQTSTITVRVRSAADVAPIQDAEISYFDRDGIKIFIGGTNSEGYLRFQVPFMPGDQVVLVAGKFGEFTTQTISYTIKNPTLGPNECNFYLRVFTGLKVRGHIYDNGLGGNQGIGGVEISVPNPTGGQERYFTSPEGHYEFNTIFEAGQKIPFTVKAEGYDLLSVEKTLQVEGPGNNVFDFRLQPEPRINWPKCLLWGSGGLAVVSIGSYLLADVSYENYKDFGDRDREIKYRRANRLNRTSIVTGISAVAVFTVSRCLKKKKRKQNNKSTPTTDFYGNVSPIAEPLSPLGGPHWGLAFSF